ncbi:MAG: CubicO group peptidase (beta-lactamase class C family), partial [Maribacter sp.]
MRYLTTVFFLLSFILVGQSQEYYFPERNAVWEQKSAKAFSIDNSRLEEAVLFAKSNEYLGSRDLRIAILKGFENEPFHNILGPTKKRGGPAGMILKNGHIVAVWGDTKRVDMTFSVTKSFLSTMAGLAFDNGLIANTNDKVRQYIWDGTFDGNHNSKVNWEHLLQQNSAWTGAIWGGKDWADRPPKEGDIDDWKFEEPKEPGTFMEYNDVRVNVLSYALTHVWRKPMPLVLKENIMDKIGASTTWRWYGYDHAWTEV